MLGLRVESSPLLASEWALREQIGINAKLFFFMFMGFSLGLV